MRRLTCHAYGTPPDLRVEPMSPAAVGDGQVLVAVEAANVAFVDRLLLRGAYQRRPEPPFTPGTLFAGTVVEAGAAPAGQPTWEPGDRVAGLSLAFGAFATHVTVPPLTLAALPEAISASSAAVALESYGTARFALEHRARLRPRDRVLVLGARGAVGHAAVDLALHLGAQVLAVTSRPEAVAEAFDGREVKVVDHRAVSLREAARSWAPDGVDVVVDPVGGALASPSLRSLGTEGRYLVIGFASGEIPALELNQVLLRNRQVIGVEWGAWLAANLTSISGELDVVLSRLASDAVTPLPAAEVSFAGLVDALSGDRELSSLVLVP
jgi:NADPH:quinone reductase